MLRPQPEGVASVFYWAGLTAGIADIAYAALAAEPQPRAVSAGISATFLFSVMGGTLRVWANPLTSWKERMASTTAMISLATACVSSASGATPVATVATLAGGVCIGAWNAAMLQRLHASEPAGVIEHHNPLFEPRNPIVQV